MLSSPLSRRLSFKSLILSALSLTLSNALSWSSCTCSSLCAVCSIAKSMNIVNVSIAGAKSVSLIFSKNSLNFPRPCCIEPPRVVVFPLGVSGVPSAFKSPFIDVGALATFPTSIAFFLSFSRASIFSWAAFLYWIESSP